MIRRAVLAGVIGAAMLMGPLAGPSQADEEQQDSEVAISVEIRPLPRVPGCAWGRPPQAPKVPKSGKHTPSPPGCAHRPPPFEAGGMLKSAPVADVPKSRG